MISGTPTASRHFPFTVRVADTGGQQDTQALSIRHQPDQPASDYDHLATGWHSRSALQFRVQATGGIGTLTWSVSAGSLPAGLMTSIRLGHGWNHFRHSASGGSFNFTVRVTDSVGQTDTQALSITVDPALRLPLPPSHLEVSARPIASKSKPLEVSHR